MAYAKCMCNFSIACRIFQVEYPELTNMSEDEHLSEEEKSDKQKANPVAPSSAAGTPSQQPAEVEEEESENDDPTSNGGNVSVQLCVLQILKLVGLVSEYTE